MELKFAFFCHKGNHLENFTIQKNYFHLSRVRKSSRVMVQRELCGAQYLTNFYCWHDLVIFHILCCQTNILHSLRQNIFHTNDQTKSGGDGNIRNASVMNLKQYFCHQILNIVLAARILFYFGCTREDLKYHTFNEDLILITKYFYYLQTTQQYLIVMKLRFFHISIQHVRTFTIKTFKIKKLFWMRHTYELKEWLKKNERSMEIQYHCMQCVCVCKPLKLLILQSLNGMQFCFIASIFSLFVPLGSTFVFHRRI